MRLFSLWQLTIAITMAVSVKTWTIPMPQYAQGLLGAYGNQRLVEANADWHGYDLSPYKDRCGISAISPGDLGREVWVRVDGRDWYGPCLFVDVAGRNDFAGSVYDRHEIAEVPFSIAAMFGFRYGRRGYTWKGPCPPDEIRMHNDPSDYRPPLEWDYGLLEVTPSFYPYPKQQLPTDCRSRFMSFAASGPRFRLFN